jgi:transcriptional regulator with XRE-family HTH domain
LKLAENLKHFRKKSGISQEELAEICQVSRQAIAKWENGESVPTLDNLVFLADYYKVSLDELVGRTVHNNYKQIKEYLLKFSSDDIPTSEEDDISAIVKRYMRFVEKMELSPEDKLKGLEEIFLS